MEEACDRERLSEIIETVMRVARGDYSVQNKLSAKNDDIDALAMGLNMMIEDLRENVDLELKNRKIEAINAELMKAKEKAQESDRLKSAFLSNISHEIRTPLNAVIGFAALLKQDYTNRETNEKYLTSIEKAGEQLLALFNDVLDISRIESNQLTIRKEFHYLLELMDQVADIASQDERLKSKPGLKLVTNYPEYAKECYIYTDQIRFKQVFMNLIGNAIRFTDEGFIEIGWTRVSKPDGNFLELFVKDTGIGIPGDLQERIFERFMQMHPDRFPEGTGLGLSIARGLINSLGGKIWVESEPGKGSVFYVRFPCIQKEDTQKDTRRDTSSKMGSHGNLSNSLIYIADDTESSLMILEEILRPFGPEIRHAGNGQELIDLIELQEPDLVFLDIRMPVMDGYQAVKEIRKRNHTFPVVAQTSYAMSDERIAILNSGCDEYISKPLAPDEVMRVLSKHLSGGE